MIRQYIGRLGQGKTTMMIFDAWRFLSTPGNKYRIISNQPILLKGLGMEPIMYPPTERDELLHEFMTSYNTLFLLDEIQLLFPAYDKKAIDSNVQARLAYIRKYGNALLYTSQGYNHVHKRIRDLTNEVALCRKTGMNPLWAHVATYYDPQGFDLSGIIDPYDDKYVLYRRYAFRWTIKKIYKAFDTTYTTQTANMTAEFKQPKEIGVKLGLYKEL